MLSDDHTVMESATKARRRRKEASIDQRLQDITSKLDGLHEAVQIIAKSLVLAPPGLPVTNQCRGIDAHDALSKQVKSLELASSSLSDRLDRLSTLVCSIPEIELFTAETREHLATASTPIASKGFGSATGCGSPVVADQPDAEQSPLQLMPRSLAFSTSVDAEVQTSGTNTKNAIAQTSEVLRSFPVSLHRGQRVVSNINHDLECGGTLCEGDVGIIMGNSLDRDTEDFLDRVWCRFRSEDQVYGINLLVGEQFALMQEDHRS